MQHQKPAAKRPVARQRNQPRKPATNRHRRTSKKRQTYTEAQLAGKQPFLVERHLEKDSLLKAVQYVFLFFHLLVFIAAMVAIVFLAMWAINRHDVFKNAPYSLTGPWIVYLCTGVLILLLCSLAIVGSLLESRTLLFSYAALLTFIMFMLIFAVVVALVFKKEVKENVEKSMKAWLEHVYIGEDQNNEIYDKLWLQYIKSYMAQKECCSFYDNKVKPKEGVINFWRSTKWGQCMSDKVAKNLKANSDLAVPLVPAEFCCKFESCPGVASSKWDRIPDPNYNMDTIITRPCNGLFGTTREITVFIGLACLFLAILLFLILLIMSAVTLYRSVIQVEHYFDPQLCRPRSSRSKSRLTTSSRMQGSSSRRQSSRSKSPSARSGTTVSHQRQGFGSRQSQSQSRPSTNQQSEPTQLSAREQKEQSLPSRSGPKTASQGGRRSRSSTGQRKTRQTTASRPTGQKRRSTSKSTGPSSRSRDPKQSMGSGFSKSTKNSLSTARSSRPSSGRRGPSSKARSNQKKQPQLKSFKKRSARPTNPAPR